MKKFNVKKNGFTLLEILLVLAIIGTIITIGVSSYGIVRKKIKLDIAANTIESVITEVREKTRSGYYENTGDVNEAASICFGFRLTKGEFIQKIQAPYDRLQSANNKCIKEKAELLNKTEYTDDLEIKEINFFGNKTDDKLDTFFAPPDANIELITSPIQGEEPLLKVVLGYVNSDEPKDERIVVLNMLTGNVFYE